MTEPPPPAGGKAHARRERAERLRRALRDNLRRRKEQARARADRRGDADMHQHDGPESPA